MRPTLAASSIPPDTLQAYLETIYTVYDEPPFALQIGQTSTELAGIHARHGSSCSAFITACNPLSQPLDDELNAARQAALATELSRYEVPFLKGIGQHPSNEWPGEESFLVLGLDLDAAKSLAIRFDQNAFVWRGSDAVPQLIVLR